MACESCRAWGNRKREMNRRATRARAHGRINSTDELIARVAALGHRCYWCGINLDFVRRKAMSAAIGDATLDHLVDLSRGGSGAVGNLVPACFGCNQLRALVAGGVDVSKLVMRARQWGRTIPSG